MILRDKNGRFVRTKPDYKLMYENEVKAFDKVFEHLIEAEEQRDYLFDHAPFWLRWMYNRKFKKDK